MVARRFALSAGTLVIAGVLQIGWRTAAALSGVLVMGWLVSAVPAMLEAGASLNTGSTANAAPSVSHDGLLSLAPRTDSDLAQRPEWVPLPKPVATFNLGINDLDGQAIRFDARREQRSGLREDMFRTGDFAGSGTLLHLALRRASTEDRPSLFVDITRLTAEPGLALIRSSQPITMASKFGTIETADVLLSDPGALPGAERSCIAFRHRADGVAFGFDGWYCGSAARAVDRQKLTCLFDRLQLLGAGDDRPLRAYFAKAELARQNSCVTPKLQSAGRKTSWLDADQPAPKLRPSGGQAAIR